MQKPDFAIEKEVKRLNDLLAVCERVDQTLQSKGWTEIIEPLMDKSITDITGCKMPNGRWHGGLLDKARKDEKREYYIGYKQALIDLHRRIYGYKDSIVRIKGQRETLIAGKSKGTSLPLVDDTRYGKDFTHGR